MTEVPSAGRNFVGRAVSGGAWITVGMVTMQVISLAVFVTVAHFLSPADFGLISVCFVVLQTSKSLLIDNFANAVTRKSTTTPLEYSTAFWLTVGVSCLSFITIEASAGLLQRLFDIAGLAHIMQEMGAIMLVMGLGHTHECWMIRNFHFRALTIRGIVGAAVGGAAGAALAVFGYGVMALVVQQVLTFTVALALLWVSCPWRPELAFSRRAAAEILHFMLQTMPGSIVGILNQNCDIILVAYFFGSSSTGIYSAGKRLRLALQLAVATPVTGIAMPILADIQADPERLRRALLSAILLICAVCAPLFLGTSAVAEDVVHLMFGARWEAAAPVLAWLAAGGFVSVLIGCNDTVFIVRGRPLCSFYVSIIYTGLAVVGFAVCAPFGSAYLALPFVAPFILTLPISAWMVTLVTRVTLGDWLRATAPAVGAAFFMFVSVRLLGSQLDAIGTTVRLVVLCPAGALIYVSTLMMFGRGTTRTLLELLRKSTRYGHPGVTK